MIINDTANLMPTPSHCKETDQTSAESTLDVSWPWRVPDSKETYAGISSCRQTKALCKTDDEGR